MPARINQDHIGLVTVFQQLDEPVQALRPILRTPSGATLGIHTRPSLDTYSPGSRPWAGTTRISPSRASVLVAHRPSNASPLPTKSSTSQSAMLKPRPPPDGSSADDKPGTPDPSPAPAHAARLRQRPGRGSQCGGTGNTALDGKKHHPRHARGNRFNQAQLLSVTKTVTTRTPGNRVLPASAAPAGT